VSTVVCALPEMLEVEANQALYVARWLRLLGGVAVWGCLDLSTPGRSFYTPATLTDGTPSPRPHWSSTEQPEHVVTDASEIEVVERQEFKRFKVAIKRAAYGTPWELTDTSSRRLDATLSRAGDGATHVFEGGDVVVSAVIRRMSLSGWLKEHGHAHES